MTDIYSDGYWLEEFTVTVADLDRFHERMQRDDKPFDVTSMVKQLIKGRLEFGHEVSPSVLKSWTGKDSVRIWDPLAKWSIGDGVIVPKSIGDGDDDYACFVGEVISIEISLDKTKPNQIKIHLDGPDKLVTYKYGPLSSSNVHQFTKNLAEKKYGGVDGEVEHIVLRFGNRIVSALLHALESDERFVGLEGKWYLSDKLPKIEVHLLKAIHHTLLLKESFTAEALLPLINPPDSMSSFLVRMAVQLALRKLPDRFENVGTFLAPRWRAIPPHFEQAEVLYYAYDPQTYEVLCCPSQHLNQDSTARLQEFGIYNYVVRFAE